MNIIKQNRELTAAEIYKMTKSASINKVSENTGETFEIDAYIIYEDEKEDNITEILSILTTDGEVYATNSPTFQREFNDLVSIFELTKEALPPIKIVEGISKSGRTFYRCDLA